MTAVRAAMRELTATDRAALREFVDRDPVGNCVFAARLDHARSLHPWDLGGPVCAVTDAGAIRTACYAGGNLLPMGAAPGSASDDFALMGGELARNGRTWSSIVGRAEAVLPMWAAMQRAGLQAREVRADQPLLAIDFRPSVAPDPLVVRVRPSQVEAYLPAAAAMFSEELGTPTPPTGYNSPYRNRVEQLVNAQLAFARFDENGRVVFKAEIAAASRDCAQIQGVWVEPSLRGRGLAAPALSAVIGFALELVPVVSLYVNGYNETARRVYDRLGMTSRGTFATVLF